MPAKPRLLRALAHRNYRLFFIGNGISLVGNWMTNVAMAWLMYRLAVERDPAMATVWLGYVAFASQAPTFLFSAICGVFCDRHDRRRILVFTQALSAVQSAALAWLVFSGHATPWSVIVLAFAQGVINSLDIPARQSFVVEMIEDRADVSNAIALNSMMFNGARLIGPAMGGLLIAAVGEGWCFALDALSYVGVIVSLLMMRLAPHVRSTARASVFESLREGAQYVFGFAPVRSLITLLAVASFVGAALPTLMPAIADRLSHGHGAAMLGWLSSSVGVGALCSAIYLASRQTVVGLGRVIWIAGLVYCVALAGFAFAPNYFVGIPLLACVGGTFMLMFAGSNTMLQSMVDDHMRGRVMSFFSMAVMGMAPFGALAGGWLAAQASTRLTLLLAAGTAAAVSATFAIRLPALRKQIRPIYVRKGILREAAQGVENVTIQKVESGAVA
jgi:MFS family permease